MPSKLLDKIAVVRAMGIKWTAFRIAYALKIRCGLFERISPKCDWTRYDSDTFFKRRTDPEELKKRLGASESLPDFFAKHEDSRRKAVDDALKTIDGYIRYFGGNRVKGKFPPDWFSNYMTGDSGDRSSHWSRISATKFGDVKNIWEASRFSFMYELARGYAASKSPETSGKILSAFKEALADWMSKNPPNTGTNWMCGQEAAMRLTALMCAVKILLPLGALDARDIRIIETFCAATADRIYANIDYALSQNNNHGISECAGLITASLVFPTMRNAEKFRLRGEKALVSQLKTLFYADGSFSQYSLNYERVALDTLVYLASIYGSSGTKAPEILADTISKAGRFLARLVNPKSGGVPRYGADDGARLLQLSDFDYSDFRPTIAAAATAVNEASPFETPACEETCLNLFGRVAKSEPYERPDSDAVAAGYYTRNCGRFFLFVRCGKYFHRISHSDMLSIWLEFDGIEFVSDAGSYSYLGKPPFDRGFSTADFHNAPTADNLDFAKMASRFLKLPWNGGKLLKSESSNGEKTLICESEQYGFTGNPVRTRREIRLSDCKVSVVDTLSCEIPRTYRISWLINAESLDKIGDRRFAAKVRGKSVYIDIECADTAECSLECAVIDNPHTWISKRYNELSPAYRILFRGKERKDIVIKTEFSAGRQS